MISINFGVTAQVYGQKSTSDTECVYRSIKPNSGKVHIWTCNVESWQDVTKMEYTQDELEEMFPGEGEERFAAQRPKRYCKVTLANGMVFKFDKPATDLTLKGKQIIKVVPKTYDEKEKRYIWVFDDAADARACFDAIQNLPQVEESEN